MFPLGSRYCEIDLPTQTAWRLFSGTAPGHGCVQAICDYVDNHIAFNYQNARASRNAADAFNEQSDVSHDYAHLAITFYRCMNILARYRSGYLSDPGTPTAGPHALESFGVWTDVIPDGEIRRVAG